MDKNRLSEEAAEVYPICVECKKPVIKNKDNYETFERMHYFCFHLVFEHNNFGYFDIDESCGVAGCPWEPKDYWKKLTSKQVS